MDLNDALREIEFLRSKSDRLDRELKESWLREEAAVFLVHKIHGELLAFRQRFTWAMSEWQKDADNLTRTEATNAWMCSIAQESLGEEPDADEAGV